MIREIMLWVARGFHYDQALDRICTLPHKQIPINTDYIILDLMLGNLLQLY